MRLDIDLSAQRLSLHDHDGQLLAAYPISSALNGPGETHGSGCTPRGRHRVRACIGREAPAGAVFVGLSLKLLVNGSDKTAMQLFGYSILYLFLVFLGLVIDRLAAAWVGV